MKVRPIAVSRISHIPYLLTLLHALPLLHRHSAQVRIQRAVSVGMLQLDTVAVRGVPRGALIVAVPGLTKGHGTVAVSQHGVRLGGLPPQVHAAVTIAEPSGKPVFLGL